MNIQENVPLKEYGTLRLGGPARFFCNVKSVRDLREALDLASHKELPFIVLGGGSNMYFADDGYPGMVIQMNLCGVQVVCETKKTAVIRVASGENWDAFVADMVSRGFYGLENLSYIPGSVGGGAVQNIGAYGAEVREFIESVEVLDTQTGEIKEFSNDRCEFEYRNSFFKRSPKKRYILISVTFLLKKEKDIEISYKDLQVFFADTDPATVTPCDVRDAVIAIRKKKLPDPKKIGTLGSFFKNPVVGEEILAAVRAKYPEVSAHKFGADAWKVSTAWLIDHACDMRGFREGAFGTHPTQPLAIVHFGGGSASELKKFSKRIKDCVEKETGISLTEEVVFVSKVV